MTTVRPPGGMILTTDEEMPLSEEVIRPIHCVLSLQCFVDLRRGKVAIHAVRSSLQCSSLLVV